MAGQALQLVAFAGLAARVLGAGFRTVGSSGCTPQMVFLQPYTDNAIFIDNFHANYGGPGVNLQTGAHSTTAYVYDGTNVPVFGTSYNWRTNALRKLHPVTNTFCSAGAFFPDGTLVNPAGAEPDAANGVGDGFNALRFFAPGPCSTQCTNDWVENSRKLQVRRWYPTTVNLVNGDIAVVGGSNVGGLVLNEANINVPTYELVLQSGTPKAPVTLPILQFTTAENMQPNKSYNLYPILHLLPNTRNANEVFSLAGNQAVIWDYSLDRLVKTLPNTPLQPRAFPSSATSVILPITNNALSPTILLCGGSSADIPDPVALDDCYTISPYATTPTWTPTDRLPNGPQTMTDAILLPDGTTLLINGAHRGSGGGFQADDPVLVPLIYNHSAPLGSRFTSQPATSIPRLYHSTATLLPSGEVLVAGSNPAVGYTAVGAVPGGWPLFSNNGHQAFLHQQQRQNSRYPTEYRVEIFAPPYMSASSRPVLTTVPASIGYNSGFAVVASGTTAAGADVRFVLVRTGFHTHAVGMVQNMVYLSAVRGTASGAFTVTSVLNGSVMPPGVYLLFVVVNGVPSEGKWVKLA
ncbi:DUF1929-domain-containing protein [Pseudovirgaria hyperparasitica]|uniref:DUF1929-domain-containing protein n=1 Tax=Pseudovirgaria hyperparasitica TaxID=470096 RepID=A0A6A6VU84_9PEZI|nr:DUF1929-domain-containing protein [Pseudovirgaria hyperparasitica]KAF2753346.1 DUF1929-domain-containing protein [Pseudovirgaria hyperparasitica]